MPRTTSRSKLLTAAALAATAALATGAGAALAAPDDAPTQVSVGSAFQLTAGENAPFDAPGVQAIRLRKPIPQGYVLVGRKVSITYGAEEAWGAGRLTCPAGKTLRTMGHVGRVAPQPGGAGYVGRRSYSVIFDGPRAAPGETVAGTVFGVCR